MEFATVIGLTLLAVALAASIVAEPETDIEEANALQRSKMLSDLLSGQDILLNDPRFDGYAQVCLVGYDLIGEPLKLCKGAEENSLLVVPTGNAPCGKFLGPEDLRGRELNILMDGETSCQNVGSNAAITIVDGLDGLTYDKIVFNAR